MKKLLAVILSIAMLACCVVVASAENNDTVTATVQTVEGTFAAGDTVTLNVTMSEVEFGYALITVKMPTFDAETLEFASFDKKAMTFSGTADYKNEFSFITVDGGDDYPENKSGVICGLKFNVLKDITELSEVNVEVIAQTYDDADIIANTVKEVAVTAGGVDVAKEPTPVEVVTEAINALPAEDAITAEDADAVAAAREAYDALTDEEKATVGEDVLAKLVAAEAAIEALAPVDSSDAGSTTEPTDSTVSVVAPGTSTSTPGTSTSVPKTADNSVVFFAAILCVAMAAAFVITKKVKD